LPDAEAAADGAAAGLRRFPLQLKALLFLLLVLAAAWLASYCLLVGSALKRHDNARDTQLAYNARMLCVYFTWFVCARLALFIPCVADRVFRVHSRTHGFCHAYCVHLLLRDGPLYIFVMGSLLFWFHLTQIPGADGEEVEGDMPPEESEFHRAMQLYAICSNLVSMFCLILAYWHNKLLMEASGEVEIMEHSRSAPADTIHKLPTQPYDDSVFGDEEGKRYPADCAICLCAWEPGDLIKVTPCHHAFHEECLANWLRTARTCALCRRDLAASLEASRLASHSIGRRSGGLSQLEAARLSGLLPGAVPLGAAAVAAAAQRQREEAQGGTRLVEL